MYKLKLNICTHRPSLHLDYNYWNKQLTIASLCHFFSVLFSEYAGISLTPTIDRNYFFMTFDNT